MGKIKATKYKDYPDQRTWDPPYDAIDPDTPPHTLPALIGGRNTTMARHRRWFCIQYFTRRGYNIPAVMGIRVLTQLRISTNGGLVDPHGRLVVPANSHATTSTNYVEFRWHRRRTRWNKRPFEVDGRANKTVADLFEAAINKANRSIKPYDVENDPRFKLMSFRQWLYTYSRGTIDYRNKEWLVSKNIRRPKLRWLPRNLKQSSVAAICLVYPALVTDGSLMTRVFQRQDDPDFIRGICYRIAYGSNEDIPSLHRLTNFISWRNAQKELGWLKSFCNKPFAPPVPEGQSQQIIRSFPVIISQHRNHALVVERRYQPTTLYGMINKTIIRSNWYLFRDLSYPARVFPWINNQEIEFTAEDLEWNITEVFDHRTWDPYQSANWVRSKLIDRIRKENGNHIRKRIVWMLDNDPTFIVRSCSQIPNFTPTNLQGIDLGNMPTLQP